MLERLVLSIGTSLNSNHISTDYLIIHQIEMSSDSINFFASSERGLMQQLNGAGCLQPTMSDSTRGQSEETHCIIAEMYSCFGRRGCPSWSISGDISYTVRIVAMVIHKVEYTICFAGHALGYTGQ